LKVSRSLSLELSDQFQNFERRKYKSNTAAICRSRLNETENVQSMKRIELIATAILTLLAGGTYSSHAQNTTLIAQQAYIKASNTGGPLTGEPGGDNFGWSVAISGDTMVIGAPDEDSNATGVNETQL
jgi:hypothetical protein